MYKYILIALLVMSLAMNLSPVPKFIDGKQLRTQRKEDAAKTLALARDTLKESKKTDFDDFHRIAGCW